MYPPVETPTSPDDHNMVILDGLQKIPTPEQIPKMPRNPLKHCSDALRNNGLEDTNTAREVELKRASLKLDCVTKALDDNDSLQRNKRYSLNDRDLIMALSKRKSNTYANTTTDNNHKSSPALDNRPPRGEGVALAAAPTSGRDENENYCGGEEIDNKNGNDRIMDCGQLARVSDNTDNAVDRNIGADEQEEEVDGNGNKNRNSATTCDDNDDVEADDEEEEVEESYHRLLSDAADPKDRAGASNSSSCCMSSGGEEGLKETRNSIASSSDESVELREKADQDELQDEFDEQRELLFGHSHHQLRRSGGQEPMDMFSPTEGPLARRYAEIAQFNGKW